MGDTGYVGSRARDVECIVARRRSTNREIKWSSLRARRCALRGAIIRVAWGTTLAAQVNQIVVSQETKQRAIKVDVLACQCGDGWNWRRLEGITVVVNVQLIVRRVEDNYSRPHAKGWTMDLAEIWKYAQVIELTGESWGRRRIETKP